MEVTRNTDLGFSNNRFILEKLLRILQSCPHPTLKDLCRNGLCPVQATWALRCLSGRPSKGSR